MLNARLSSVQTRYLLQLYSEAISDQISGAPRSGFPPELVIQCPHFQPHKDQSPSPRAHLIVHQPYLWITQRKGDEICKYIAVIVCKLCNLKEARAARQSCNRITWQRYLWGRTSVSGWIFRSVTAPSWAHHLQTRGQDRFHISHNAPGDRHQNILLFFFFQLHLMISKQTTVFNQFIYLIPVGLTLNAPGLSLCLDTLSSWMVSVKVGHGEECSYLEWLEKSSWSHLEQA